MFATLIVLAVTSLVVYVLYKYRAVHNYFDQHGVKYLPGIPFFGNNFKGTFYKRHNIEDIDEVYRAFPDEKYVGYIEAMQPIIMIRDPDIIREITVKHFDHFVDHRQLLTQEIEPLLGRSLFLMRGDKWRDMRTTLSPAFTSSKMKMMMPFMVKITSNVIEYLKSHTGEDIDIDDLVRRYTNDVIASTAFGVQVNSIIDKDNEFYRTGQDMFEFGIRQNLLFLMFATFPRLTEKLGVTIFPSRIINFFTNLINETIDYREKNNVVRPDMIQLLIEAAKGILKAENNEIETKEENNKSSRQWSRSDLMGQVFIFFAAGFESSATAVGMTIHELAINQDVQDKLYQEIKEYEEQHGELTFDNIPTLKYLDCVVNESLRKWSPALIMDRECAKPYELPPLRKGAKPLLLKPGDIVYNVVNSLHMDPKYFANPDVFDPERFRDDKKHIQPFTFMPFGMGPRNCIGNTINFLIADERIFYTKYFANPDVFDPERFRDDKKHIQPFTFMPFGMGPRNCIGVRFAYMEVKIVLYHLVLNFKILKCPKTTDPIQLRPHNFNIKALGGSWVGLEARN